METPEQQRRPTIGQFAQTLNRCGLSFDARDLADILWLAQQFIMEPENPARPEEPAKTTPTPPATTVTVPQDPNTPAPEPSFNIYIDDRSPATPQPSLSNNKPASEENSRIPFSVPAAPAIRTRLDLARSLRPLMRKMPSRFQVEIDEDATVTQIAETQIPIPVLRSTPERWLDLELVVESSKTTVLWERTISELQQLLEYQGAFRIVRTWRLEAAADNDKQRVSLFPRWNEQPEHRLNQRPHSPRELRDPTGRRLVLFVSDCTSALWRRGIIYETLYEWSKFQPLAVVQMLPERLWSRTALSDGHIVKLGALEPGVSNRKLNVEGLPDLDAWNEWDEWEESEPLELAAGGDRRLLILPIITLEPEPLKSWARVVAGSGDIRTPGRVFEMAFLPEMPVSQTPTPPQTAQQRMALFRATASQTARKLAGLIAATPVSLPVIDLLREEFLPEAEQAHVAEVLLSGLLRRCDLDDEGICQYEFFEDSPEGDRVRDLLLDGVPISKTIGILNRLSEIVMEKAGRTINSFEALLEILPESEQGFSKTALPFARIGLEVLHRLGGNYTRLARRYQNSNLFQPDSEAKTEAVEFPPLQTFEYEPAIITDILERFEFETAELIIALTVPGRFGDVNGCIIQHSTAANWGYTELLGNEIGLDMVFIPKGIFQMGSLEEEVKSYDDEQPRHKVTVKSFYMGRYLITQAQWREVAAYSLVEKELDPNPSTFKGDNRPVENVGWDDVTEFCRRLSAETGRKYRIPTEAEWEYACRAGTQTPFHFGKTITPELANYNGNTTYAEGPKGEYRAITTEVGSFPANKWGLHDMHGNAWEWCEDDWHDNYKRTPTDGTAWIKENRTDPGQLLRGGSWGSFPWNCRSACRLDITRVLLKFSFGFRVVCDPPTTLGQGNSLILINQENSTNSDPP